MARYIDADALLKSIDEFIYMNESTKSLYKTIVRKQPTAFNLDKVVQELEEIYDRNDKMKKEAYEEQDWELFDIYSHLNQSIYIAISIVKAGGIDAE